MTVDLKEIICPMCSESAYKVIAQVKLSPIPVQSNLKQCLRCHTAYVSPRPDMSNENRFYEHEYLQKEKTEVWKEHRIPFFQFALRRMSRYQGHWNQPRLLDVGCGPGYFVKMAADEGWSASGIDLSHDGVKQAREVLKVEAYQGRLSQLKAQDGCYHAVTLWNVFDQMTDPSEELDRIYKLLAPGGVLLLRLSNLDCHLWVHRIWRFLLCLKVVKPEKNEPTVFHLQMFNQRSLRTALSKASFQIVEMTNAPMDSQQSDLIIHFGEIGSAFIQKMYAGLCLFIARITFGNVLIGPSLWTVARKV